MRSTFKAAIESAIAQQNLPLTLDLARARASEAHGAGTSGPVDGVEQPEWTLSDDDEEEEERLLRVNTKFLARMLNSLARTNTRIEASGAAPARPTQSLAERRAAARAEILRLASECGLRVEISVDEAFADGEDDSRPGKFSASSSSSRGRGGVGRGGRGDGTGGDGAASSGGASTSGAPLSQRLFGAALLGAVRGRQTGNASEVSGKRPPPPRDEQCAEATAPAASGEHAEAAAPPKRQRATAEAAALYVPPSRR
ncbi:hypothetical protein EMIHUDRAFT_104002 [Emiliania huxleyi CCMP1516]|uniref:Uncharacterized protein n=2 Tax=Emiliania huxleyi TaxID=2903 RepID=A0A0D3INJ2_EMIH1|nr:hypothetical protein EMIHUDRAFT_104002 [Emiliania huxleyi CCMP1516]EOD12827.1 hypothetical protein EMIHUDRAFT_104002 [Emiliania huxleyi CCMP1516]|eukprot:XP_005765256.1 hypothetical protein EMIHUDRAFT_104002 [Emiliania huxleyi CCMP1516]